MANPRYLRKAAVKLKRLHRRVSRKGKRSKNCKQAITRLAKRHLKVSRQRKDFAVKAASALVKSSDLIAYEDLQVAHLVKNHRLAKSISDAARGLFLSWVRYYGAVHGIPVIAVPARFTTQECSGCGYRVYKSLSQRTHRCPNCGLVLDRDQNAALNILRAPWHSWQPKTVPPGRRERVALRSGTTLLDSPPRRAVFARARRKRAG